MTPEQQRMQEILNKKGQQIILALMDQLSTRNKGDLEVALNSHTILMEFTENDHCFNLLIAPEALTRLITVVCQGLTNPQLRYAMNLLTTIINEFSSTEKEISDERRISIQEMFGKYFTDICYNCIIVLMQQHPDESSYVNTTHTEVKKVGYTRLRAMELLKSLFLVVSKMGQKGKELVTPLLRSKIIDAMLHMIRTYPFCSLSHSQCIQIFQAMKDNFEQADLDKLKEFILVELEGQARFEFPSGRTCSGPNMG